MAMGTGEGTFEFTTTAGDGTKRTYIYPHTATPTLPPMTTVTSPHTGHITMNMDMNINLRYECLLCKEETEEQVMCVECKEIFAEFKQYFRKRKFKELMDELSE